MSSQPIQPFTSLSRDVDLATVAAVCIGTGRFLRAVLVHQRHSFVLLARALGIEALARDA